MDWSQPISIGLILLMIAVLPCIYGALSVDVLSEEQMVCVGRGGHSKWEGNVVIGYASAEWTEYTCSS